MSHLQRNVNLKALNTFGIEAFCDYFTEINSVDDFMELLKTDVYAAEKKLIVGGGSNLLFTQNFNGLVIKNNIKGISIVSENENQAIVRAGAGEIWHDLVLWCLEKGYAGMENLSLIPGCVGASPMQNIGAYGVELKEVFESLDAVSLESGEIRTFSNSECEFGYRESVFKNKYKNSYLITYVSFRLRKQALINTSYGAINDELRTHNIVEPGIKDVSNAVIRIRKSKLPDPKEKGNAGSFFKNPEITAEHHASLKQKFETLVAYPLANGRFKLAAGWLIEQCGLKGLEKGAAAVHDKQALVLVNKNPDAGITAGRDVLDLSIYVMEKVYDKFQVRLEREVNII
jgi:UDP-N-acetylmuramate dehydrogenase